MLALDRPSRPSRPPGRAASRCAQLACALRYILTPSQPFGVPAAQAAMAALAAAYASPALPHGVGGAALGAPADAVTKRLAEVSPRQMHDLMVQMRTLAQSNPQQARQLLLSNPALTRALFQAQLMLGMVASAAEGAPVGPPSAPQPALAPQATPPPPALYAQPQVPMQQQPWAGSVQQAPYAARPPAFAAPPQGMPPGAWQVAPHPLPLAVPGLGAMDVAQQQSTSLLSLCSFHSS